MSNGINDPGGPDDWQASLVQQEEWRRRSTEATAKGAQALNRLLHLAETRESGQTRRIALFIGACWNGKRHFDLFDLRSLDVSVGDDMLAVLDALRWGQADIQRLVPNGDARIVDVLTRWNMYGPDQPGQAIVQPPTSSS